MAGSSSRGFPWTPEKTSDILEVTWDIVKRGRLDPFADETIERVVSRVHGFKICTEFHGITSQDLKAHLHYCRQRYLRVCELANHPHSLGFLSKSKFVWMAPEKYEAHIMAFPDDAELLNKPIPDYNKLFLLFGGGVPPGSNRRRCRQGKSKDSSSHSAPPPPPPPVTEDDDDDDFMPPKPWPVRGQVPKRGRS